MGSVFCFNMLIGEGAIMESEDLRSGVIRVFEGRLSRNAAARRLGFSISSAVRWVAA